MRPVTTGVDVTSVPRIPARMQPRPTIATKQLSPEHVANSDGRPERLAARWAAKEAVRKVYGSSGMALPTYPSISVRHRPGGAPEALVGGAVVAGLELSLSHDAELAVAVAVLTEGSAPRFEVPAEVGMSVTGCAWNWGSHGSALLFTLC
jgi:holo-[acyl-carrier protein] synthase